MVSLLQLSKAGPHFLCVSHYVLIWNFYSFHLDCYHLNYFDKCLVVPILLSQPPWSSYSKNDICNVEITSKVDLKR